jgi:hypothetical protein
LRASSAVGRSRLGCPGFPRELFQMSPSTTPMPATTHIPRQLSLQPDNWRQPMRAVAKEVADRDDWRNPAAPIAPVVSPVAAARHVTRPAEDDVSIAGRGR